MENNILKEIELAMAQIEKYNNDFKSRYLHLKTFFYEMEVLNTGIKKLANFDMSKTRSQKQLDKLQNSLDSAIMLNHGFVTRLEVEKEELSIISDYLIKKQPQLKQLNSMMFSSDKDMVEILVKVGAVKVITNIKKINNNLNICNNYTLPKLDALLKQNLKLKDRLQAQQAYLNNIKQQKEQNSLHI